MKCCGQPYMAAIFASFKIKELGFAYISYVTDITWYNSDHVWSVEDLCFIKRTRMRIHIVCDCHNKVQL